MCVGGGFRFSACVCFFCRKVEDTSADELNREDLQREQKLPFQVCWLSHKVHLYAGISSLLAKVPL